jgi:hypothetical protein
MFNCNNNNIGIIQQEIGNLINLQLFDCSENQIKIIPQEIGNLINLHLFDCADNQIKIILIEIINCRRLHTFNFNDNEIENIDIRIQRFIDRIENYNNHNIYSDTQNVHSSSIQRSVKNSINNIMKDIFTIEEKDLHEYIMHLECYPNLLEYFDNREYHSELLITFYELFIKVFGRIINSEHKDELFKRLNEEMLDSECKCYTGRISRLVNVLSGYYDDVNIRISDNEHISSIILKIIDGNEMNDDYRIIIKKELKEVGYSDDIIDNWIN